MVKTNVLLVFAQRPLPLVAEPTAKFRRQHQHLPGAPSTHQDVLEVGPSPLVQLPTPHRQDKHLSIGDLRAQFFCLVFDEEPGYKEHGNHRLSGLRARASDECRARV